MATIGTFGAFTTARLGIYASHNALSVTANNISNINTTGYTRQMMEQKSLRTGGADRYQSHGNLNIGTGVLSIRVDQIRDPYLDIRFRTENASVGAMDAKHYGLEELQAVLDEVGDGEGEFGIIAEQLGDFNAMLQNLTDQTGHEEYDHQVRSSAEALTKLFNSYASQLERVYDNTVTNFHEDIEAVNEILTNIRDLNSSIRKSEIHGDMALELRDQRNVLIDELSGYMKIDVTYSMEDIGAGKEVEKLTIKLGNANPDATVTTDSAVLVDGRYAAQLVVPEKNQVLNGNYDIEDPNSERYVDGTEDNTNFNVYLSKLLDSKGREWQEVSETIVTPITEQQYQSYLAAANGSNTWEDLTFVDEGMVVQYEAKQDGVDDQGNPLYVLNRTNYYYTQEIALDDNDLYGSLQSVRELLTETGEFASAEYIADVDENAATKRGIQYYQKSLDLLANQFAAAFNAANTGNHVDENGVDLGTQPAEAGVLFSNNGGTNDTTGITASNISVALGWSDGHTQIVRSYVKPTGMDDVASTDNSNVLHMVALMDTKLEYIPSAIGPTGDNTPMFEGTFGEMLSNISAVLGNDMNSTKVMLDTYYAASVELDASRDSVSSVDLNDEAMNLMQFSKSYQAASRMMTVIDEVLDKLINGTGVAGR